MKVNLIDYTGCGHADPADYAARLLVYVKNTRLTQGEFGRAIVSGMPPEKIKEELAGIAKTIRSSWEFVDYTFEVLDVTRAYTHQQVRTRTGAYAQQSQRTVDMSGSIRSLVPITVEAFDGGSHWLDFMRHASQVYEFYVTNGVPPQDARGVLPTNVLTNIICKFNLRTMADLVGKRENLRAQGEYADVVRGMKADLLTVHPWAEQFLHPERTQTPALDAILKEHLGTRMPAEVPRLNDALKELDALKGTWG